MSDITRDFIATTKKIVAEVRSVLTTLHLIQNDVGIIKENVIASKKTPASQERTDDPRGQEDQQESRRFSFQGEAPNNDANQQEDNTQKKKADRFYAFKKRISQYLKEPKTWVELLTLILLFLYTREARKANDLTTEGRRPYLWQVSSAQLQRPSMHYVPGQKPGDADMTVGTEIENFGQSPAITTRFTGDVEMGGTSGFLRKLSAHNWMPYESVMPPGRIDVFNVPTKETIPPDASSIRFIPEGTVALLLRIQYKDTDGRLFESDLCVFTPNGMSQGAEAAYCPADLHLTRVIDCQKEACEQ